MHSPCPLIERSLGVPSWDEKSGRKVGTKSPAGLAYLLCAWIGCTYLQRGSRRPCTGPKVCARRWSTCVIDAPLMPVPCSPLSSAMCGGEHPIPVEIQPQSYIRTNTFKGRPVRVCDRCS